MSVKEPFAHISLPSRAITKASVSDLFLFFKVGGMVFLLPHWSCILAPDFAAVNWKQHVLTGNNVSLYVFSMKSMNAFLWDFLHFIVVFKWKSVCLDAISSTPVSRNNSWLNWISKSVLSHSVNITWPSGKLFNWPKIVCCCEIWYKSYKTGTRLPHLSNLP